MSVEDCKECGFHGIPSTGRAVCARCGHDHRPASVLVPRVGYTMDKGEGPVVVATAMQRVSTEIGRAGRNDPCPCGSGRKTKACCRR